MTCYSVTLEDKPVETKFLRGVFADIYQPIVPVTTANKLLHYQKNQENFYVHTNKEGNASITGRVSPGLANKLKEYNIEISRE